MISDTLIQEYQRLCRELHGVELTQEEAHREFISLVELVHYTTPTCIDQEIQSYYEEYE